MSDAKVILIFVFARCKKKIFYLRGIIICITFVAMIASYYKISETNNWVTVDLFANRAYFTDLQVLINYNSGEITIVDYKGEVAECNPEQIDLFITP